MELYVSLRKIMKIHNILKFTKLSKGYILKPE